MTTVRQLLKQKRFKGKTIDVALITVNEGSFIGWEVKPIHTKAQLRPYLKLPSYVIKEVGLLGVEPAYLKARKAGIWQFVVVNFVTFL